MKISYVLQLKDFSIMFGIGLIIGIFYEILNIFGKIKKNIALQIIVDLIFSVVCCGTFLIFVNIINMGQFRAFLLIGYLLGILLERITLGKLFAKVVVWVYTKFVIAKTKFLDTKVGRLFK